MSRKWRLLAWLIYSVVAFLVLLIGFHWILALPLSLIVGFGCMLINEIIQLLTKINDKLEEKQKPLKS